MPLGGINVVLRAPARDCLGDIILRAGQWHWPGERCFFQDAEDEDHVYALDDTWVWKVGAASKEFFIYQNEQAVRAWAEGPTPGNSNTMLHFLIGEPLPEDPELVEVSLVCDKLTPAVRLLIANLKASFSSLVEGNPSREAA